MENLYDFCEQNVLYCLSKQYDSYDLRKQYEEEYFKTGFEEIEYQNWSKKDADKIIDNIEQHKKDILNHHLITTSEYNKKMHILKETVKNLELSNNKIISKKNIGKIVPKNEYKDLISTFANIFCCIKNEFFFDFDKERVKMDPEQLSDFWKIKEIAKFWDLYDIDGNNENIHIALLIILNTANRYGKIMVCNREELVETSKLPEDIDHYWFPYPDKEDSELWEDICSITSDYLNALYDNNFKPIYENEFFIVYKNTDKNPLFLKVKHFIANNSNAESLTTMYKNMHNHGYVNMLLEQQKQIVPNNKITNEKMNEEYKINTDQKFSIKTAFGKQDTIPNDSELKPKTPTCESMVHFSNDRFYKIPKNGYIKRQYYNHQNWNKSNYNNHNNYNNHYNNYNNYNNRYNNNNYKKKNLYKQNNSYNKPYYKQKFNNDKFNEEINKKTDQYYDYDKMFEYDLNGKKIK